MRKKIAMVYAGKGESRHQNTALLLVSAAFLFGGFLGWSAENHVDSVQYVKGFLEVAKEGGLTSGMWQEVWNLAKWPALVMASGYLPMTGLIIPGVICLRGFLLSYSIAAFLEAGLKEALLLFGPTCILTLPVLFILATESLLRKAGEPSKRKPAVILACLLALCLCAVLDQMVIPMFFI